MKEFSFKQSMQNEGSSPSLLFQFEGSIDEDANFPQIDTGKFKQVHIDLQNVKAINSVGIREWLDWIRPVAESAQIVLENCPKALVFQFNMVEGFLPASAHVSSFYVPFYNEDEDSEENVLFTVGRDVLAEGGQVQLKFDAKASLKGPGEWEMDVNESKYFQFLKRN